MILFSIVTAPLYFLPIVHKGSNSHMLAHICYFLLVVVFRVFCYYCRCFKDFVYLKE